MRAQPEQDRAQRGAESDADSGVKFCHSLHGKPLRCDASRRALVHTSNSSARIVLAFLWTAVLVSAATGAQAQAYPNRPIHIIAPFPAGGGYDFLSRLVGAEMSKTFGQPVVVENKAGANGNIGTDAAAKRSEERRVGKECRARWAASEKNKKMEQRDV